ncbi:abasic site processing protein HMCES-like [Paramacrobiotus metropolitanus]|uniref:abasic site processing protein HMCES-like n=1 Tax=Paramacrobiotus metropolitanus TaxID=2943436 RepID=UPI002445CF57|nr:abasic site processing protein HMCES-like [Paramacrobiotus metropolitanus]
MCGRFACALDPGALRRACRYRTSNGTQKEPPLLGEYYPSTNIAPTNYSPVLVSSEHFPAVASESDEFVIKPMKFGLIPSWHKGDDNLPYSTINCRLDGLLTKRTFSVPLKKGKRCAVLAEGFYEWKKLADKHKQPYLIYLPENKQYYAEDSAKKNHEDNFVPLKFAAVFDEWHSKEGETVYSYSIVTTDAAPSLKFLHDRMPGILRTDDDLRRWLDSKDVSAEEALELIHPVDDLAFHAVSTAVGNVGYKETDATKPINVAETGAKKDPKPLPKGQKTMEAFFSPAKRSVENEDTGSRKKQ